MKVAEKVQVILLANDALMAVVPGARIKTPGDWQGLVRPYIIHKPIVGEVFHTYDEGLQPLRIWDVYEIAVYATTYGQAAEIADLLTTAMDGYTDSDVQSIRLNEPAVPRDAYDGDVKVSYVFVNFTVAGGLT